MPLRRLAARCRVASEAPPVLSKYLGPGPQPNSAEGLCRAKNGVLYRLRELYHCKSLKRIQIVFPAFINYADIPIPRRILIWHYSIDLVHLQRRWIAAVVDANRKKR